MGPAAALALVAWVLVGAVTTLAWARHVDVVRPAVVGLVVQGVMTIGLYAMVGLWAPDAVVYDQLGQEFAAFWGGGAAPSAVSNGKEAFPVMLGAVYFVVGPAPAVGLAMNWCAHGLLIPALASIARRLDLPTRPTAWIAALFPPALFWSAFLLRESITWLLSAVFLYAVAGMARRVVVRDLVVMVAALVAMMWFRGTAAIIVAGVSMVVLVLTASGRTFLPRLGAAVLALLVLSPRLLSLLYGYTTVSDIEAKRSDLSTADTSFGSDPAVVVRGGETSAPTSLVDSVTSVAFGPYPWEWPSLGAPFALDAVLWIAVLALAVLGWWRARNRKDLLVLILPALALSGALMLTSGNYGTMQRLRVQTTVLLIPVAAAGATLVAGWISGRRSAHGRRAAAASSDSPR